MQVEPRSRFDNFVVGSANRLAVAAARAVAESPGAVYNPLFIYSGVGARQDAPHGRDRQSRREQRSPSSIVEYVPLDDFVEQLHAAIAVGETDAVQAALQSRRTCCCIDDMQFLTGRRETQTELLRIFNALQGSGRQIVMTSDRPPAEIADVDERLDHAAVRWPDRRHRRAGLRDARRDPARASARSGSARSRRGVIEELARLEFSERARAAGRAEPARSRTQTLGRRRCTPAQVRAILGDSPEPAPARRRPPSAGRARTSSSASSRTSPAPSRRRSSRGRCASARRSRTGRAKATAPRCSSALMAEATAPPNVEALLRGFGQAVEQLARARGAGRRRLDPSLGGNELFRDPERVGEAEQRSSSRRSPAPCRRRVRRPRSRARAFEESSVEPDRRARRRRGDRRAGPALQPAVPRTAPSGVGKTHLLQRDRQRAGARRRRGTARVACVGGAAVRRRADRRAAGGHRRALARALPRRRRAAHRRRAVRRRQGAHAGRAVPRLQRTSTPRASSSCSRATVRRRRRSRDSRSGCARASRADSSSSSSAPDRALREKLYARFLADARRRTPTPELLALSRRASGDERARADRHRASVCGRGRGVGRSRHAAAGAAGARAGGRGAARAPPTRAPGGRRLLPRRREDRVGVARRSPAASIEELR